MIRGGKIGLRARTEADVPILHVELHDDLANAVRASARPWQPIALGPSSPFGLTEPTESRAVFSVVELASDELAGDCTLWGIDTHNRFGHVGMSLLPGYRGRGLATDVVRALCYYGFVVRGLNRLQLETLADNEPMKGTATRCGFVHEGTIRRGAWVEGEFVDEVIMGLLADEWRAAQQ
jgi:RimJ/RimL family protein N-acetyltransferase